jgi:hypothetical protein
VIAVIAVFYATSLAVVAALGLAIYGVLNVGGLDNLALTLPIALVLGSAVAMLLTCLVQRVPFHDDGVIVDPQSYPALWAALEETATAVDARIPAKVVLVPDATIRAGADCSAMNLLWTPKPTLLLGIGLLRVLSWDEFRAALAKEMSRRCLRGSRLTQYCTYVQSSLELLSHGIPASDDEDNEDVTAVLLAISRALCNGLMAAYYGLFVRIFLAVSADVIAAGEARARLLAASLTTPEALSSQHTATVQADNAFNAWRDQADVFFHARLLPENIYAVQSIHLAAAAVQTCPGTDRAASSREQPNALAQLMETGPIETVMSRVLYQRLFNERILETIDYGTWEEVLAAAAEWESGQPQRAEARLQKRREQIAAPPADQRQVDGPAGSCVCPHCARDTPRRRGLCLYCGEALE